MSGKKRATKLTSKHLAYKALGLANISRSQCKVGIAIIDHMNIRTGRCDPGLRRLASDTLLTVETVRVSVARICDPDDPGRLFDNLNPGQGKSPRYVPRWAIMKAMVDDFEARTMSPTVQKTLDSSNLETVQPHLDSDCPEPIPSTVQQRLDKTNLRTKGARPAAHQAARPARAPSHSEDENIVEADQVKRHTASEAFFNEIPVPGRSFDQKAEGVEPASPGSPSRLDGGSPAPPSEAASQSSLQSPASQPVAPSVARPSRKPDLPPINDQALYNRLTKRSRS